MFLKVNDKKTDLTVYVARSAKAKVKGLSGLKEIDFGLFFPETNCIHTITMKTNIDIIFFHNNKIVKIVENAKTGRPMIYHVMANSVLELPAGTVEKNKITKNAEIMFAE